MTHVKSVALLSAALLLPGIAPANAAEEYPSRPMRLIIPWSPGGITDVISRTLGAVMSESMGQQIVPDNRPGAAGTLGVSVAAQANADGYTLLMTDVPSHAISATLYKSLTYNPAKDIEPIALPSKSPTVLVVYPKLGVNSIQQLIDYAKANPGKLRFASSGPGSITHLTSERFKAETGIKALHVPYKGGSPGTAAVVAGESQAYFSCISAAIPHIKAGRLTFLGITLPKRSPLWPDVPAVAEVVPGFVMGCNTGFFAPAGTPPKITARLHAEVMKAVKNPRVQTILTTNSAESSTFTQAEFKAHVAEEIVSWGKVIRESGLKVN
ncbi:MAG: tripartite tricarboxylate transporter substrate binding protein [Betaproteobacteria bacterium]|jgi:tripartite-type tricarboxylate transporter receptor subunit TctC|nr:tripartite tricarboxylate transporter substrate binding protein [Betaproteobacteria bacterium]MDH5341644.1 tripartite tricarboxylate transporter substrate binding protein [Betaproteobacteria bacterium]